MESSFKVKTTVEASVALSEDPEKVMKAIENVVGESKYGIERADRSIRLWSADSGALARMHDQLRDRSVKPAARRFALKNRGPHKVTFLLNRQAAFEGIIALCSSEGESPLGPIYVRIESRDLDRVLDWLTA